MKPPSARPDNVQEIIDRLALQVHPEGGYFAEVYRADEILEPAVLPARYSTSRSFATSIFYLLTADTFSTMHRVASDEIFHFYLGDPVEQLRLFPDGGSEVKLLGSDIAAGHSFQLLVPRGIWQGARLVEGGTFALLGATVAPGFEFSDYEEGLYDELCRSYPQQNNLLRALTRR